MAKNIIITIDGPAGSGKSTSAKLVAKNLGFTYLDTGAMYRAVTYLALKRNVIKDEPSVVELAEKARLELKFVDGKTEVILNGEDVTEAIRSYEVNSNVSEVSRIAGVRTALVKKQQEIGRNTSIVAEGRDTGTVVFPEADVKIFLTASLSQRAHRRLREFQEKGENLSLDEIEGNIRKRDLIDSSREVSPLTKAQDAVEIDTSSITIEEEVELILSRVRESINNKGN
ncbi:MAG: (d)CMP kinase [Ignavibacteria bacterium]|jgi:cytidylate kinase|nr:(d)CMP kinase [Ignavibacteria bacterium]MCU7521819.1 (d)CMP kinase [Ignavibacteria bacterium]HEX2961303.1 (d)CMP kinase [Ignavibacteriales bacterium]